MSVPLQTSAHMDDLRRQQLDALAQAKTGVGGIVWREPERQPPPAGIVADIAPFAKLSLAQSGDWYSVHLGVSRTLEGSPEEALHEAPREMLRLLRGVVAALEKTEQPAAASEQTDVMLVPCSGQCGRQEEYHRLRPCVCGGRYCAECYGQHKCKVN